MWCLVTAVVVAVLVYAWLQRGRGTLLRELDSARNAAAVAEARLTDLGGAHQALQSKADVAIADGQRLSVERERLATSHEESQKQLTEATGQLQEHRAKLGDAESRLSNLGAELQVLTARFDLASGAEQAARAEFERVDLDRQALNKQLVQAEADHAALGSQYQGLKEQLEAQKKWVEEQTESFKNTLTVEAARIMDERGKAFTDLNKKEVDAVVAPFKEELEKFRKRVDDIHTAETAANERLDERIVSLTNLNKTVSDQAERLVKALTVSSKSTGDWGETILAKILEDSGLREDHDYRLQPTIKSAKGEDLRPDAILYLPDERQLVVDSKVSNKAWTDYCAETDETRREALFRDHLASLRTHIRSLSGKGYAGSPDLKTVDFVLMFVPVEAALLTALVKDDSLYAEAYAQRIILVTPTTLMAVVRMAVGLWTFQTRMESVEEIVEVGRKLYEKFVNFADTFVDVGKAILDSRDAYEKAKGQLSTGRGNAIRLAEQLKELGITPSAGKTMPGQLLLAEPDEADGRRT
jgi:DNA recombination protein RmuC